MINHEIIESIEKKNQKCKLLKHSSNGGIGLHPVVVVFSLFKQLEKKKFL